MSFLYCSIFGDGLHKDATTKDKFSRGLQRSLFSLLEVCGLKEGLFASTKKKSNEILDKFYDLSSLVQAASSDVCVAFVLCFQSKHDVIQGPLISVIIFC